MTTDVAGPIQQASRTKCTFINGTGQRTCKGGLHGTSGGGTAKGEREARDDFLRLILSLRSMTNYTDPISITFVSRPVLLC